MWKIELLAYIINMGNKLKYIRPAKEEFATQHAIKPDSELAAIYGVSKRTIQCWASQMKIRKPSKKIPKKQLLDFYSKHTGRETAAHFNVSIRQVEELCKKYDFKKTDEMKWISRQTEDGTIKIREKMIKEKRLDNLSGLPDKDELFNLYNSRGRNYVCDFYGVSLGTIDYWLKKLEIPLKGGHIHQYKNVELSEIQQDVLLGSMLGDGSLSKIGIVGKSKIRRVHSYFAEAHSWKQRNYLKWKYDILLPLSSIFTDKVCSGIKKQNGKVVRDDSKTRYSSYMQTFCNPLLTEMERKWYARDVEGNYILNKIGHRIKIIPGDISLTPLAIAVWYFDDGSLGRNKITFNTQCFTFEECHLLADKLFNFGFKPNVTKNRNRPVIQLSSKSSLPFFDMISKYTIDCMKYKVIPNSITPSGANIMQLP